MEKTATPSKLRPWLIAASIVLILIWASTFIPVITAWNNPSEQGFVLVPVLWTTIGLLPFGIVALIDSLRGDRHGIRNARLMLILAAILWTAVGLFVFLYGKYLEMTYGAG